MKSATNNQAVAILIMRLILGFIFLMQGYGKVFGFGVDAVFNSFFNTDQYAIFPVFVLKFTAYYTSYVELIGGLLLFLGLQRDYALYALGSVLVIVTFGHGVAEPIWDLSHVMYRTILLVPLLLLPKAWDRFSIDHFMNASKE